MIPYDPDCVFCRIVSGHIPAFRIAEDERCLAFMDINPANPGHALVIPKLHAPNLFLLPASSLSATVLMAQRVAKAVRQVVAPDGLNLVQANGPGAGQTVEHFHIHVLPRFQRDNLKMAWTAEPGDFSQIQALADRLAAVLK
ncbi:HIT family protein [Telmatospirillum sp. J64-1]|uniref:HIT family protein n=1 Tax=Telmatospirillum sp. J64-1 TaxID=2502183 RepID=UPI00115E53E9|nr:HIT family protein [Telmatospirillum sp. J64-1]